VIAAGATANALSSLGVRQAVASALNKAAYINGYYAGLASVADNWLPAGTQYYTRGYLPGYDVTSARGYLSQSGNSNPGPTLDLWYPTGVPESLMPDPKGLALSIAADLTDAGFTGPHESVLGREIQPVLQRFRTCMPQRFEVARNDIKLHGAIVEIDNTTGKAIKIQRVSEPLNEPLV